MGGVGSMSFWGPVYLFSCLIALNDARTRSWQTQHKPYVYGQSKIVWGGKHNFIKRRRLITWSIPVRCLWIRGEIHNKNIGPNVVSLKKKGGVHPKAKPKQKQTKHKKAKCTLWLFGLPWKLLAARSENTNVAFQLFFLEKQGLVDLVSTHDLIWNHSTLSFKSISDMKVSLCEATFHSSDSGGSKSISPSRDSKTPSFFHVALWIKRPKMLPFEHQWM